MSYGTVPLTKDQENDVLNRIGYSTAQLKADVVQLRRWLNKQEHLPACRLKETDAFLSTFLTGSKGSIERSKRRIDAYYTFRGRNNIFTGRTDPSYLERALKISGAAELRRRDSTTSVVFVSLTDVDPEHFDGIDAMKAFLLYFEYKFRMGSGIQGSQIYLVDFKNYSTSHLLRLPPAELKSFIEFFHVSETGKLQNVKREN
ncbi:CRAL/TRIO domain [Nesidiocoris tenuis]|uniref:CRAL/TRIO domain n=1 Tax=Nesidiocoris tenuis TaxID=355587 RepID=A0ABN7B3R8_9HEMI|nr:CRAL/TRIO domain [Nesidiocoris tenuis]